MERKLIKQGYGGLTVYLPKKWIEKRKLTEKDQVSIREVGDHLVIESVDNLQKEVQITLDEDNFSNLKNLLTHIYRKGFSRIILKTPSKSALEEIKKILSRVLLGFEITSANDKEIIIENISEPNEQKYEVILRKIFFIIKETQEVMKESFLSSKFRVKEMNALKDQNDRFILFCKRLIEKGSFEGSSFIEWELLTFLMHIQHSYYYLFTYFSKNKLSKKEEIESLLVHLEEYFDLFRDAYYNKDISSVNKINNLKKEYQFGSVLKLIENSEGKDAVVFSYIKDIFRIIQIGSSPILSAIIKL